MEENQIQDQNQDLETQPITDNQEDDSENIKQEKPEPEEKDEKDLQGEDKDPQEEKEEGEKGEDEEDKEGEEEEKDLQEEDKDKDKDKTDSQKKDKAVGKPGQQKMDITIFFLLLIPAIIKDTIEMILGIIPFINLFAWIFSLPFTAFILFISIIAGVRKDLILTGQLIDLIPLANILPVSTITIVMCAFSKNKSPKLLKNISKK